MIAPMRAGCKACFGSKSAESERPIVRFYRHGIVSGIIIRPHLRQPHALLTWEHTITAFARFFRPRIPQPPAPRGRRGRAYAATTRGPTRVGPFLFGASVIPGRSRSRANPESGDLYARFRVSR